jgi:N-acetyl-gamma-glutamylphosphate reductase
MIVMGNEGRVSVGIVGASGYGGVQLVRLLMDHPELELVYLGGESSAGKSFADIYPHLAHQVNLPNRASRSRNNCQPLSGSISLAAKWNGLQFSSRSGEERM